MRFIRIFVILFILVLSLAAASPIYAADSYFNVSGCPDDPAQLCTASGDGVNTRVPLSKFVNFVAATEAWLLNNPQVTYWAGKLWPKDSYRIGKDKLNIYGSQVQTASDTDLNPAELQAREQHDATPKEFSMTSRLCVYQPSDGTLIGEGIVSTTTVKNTDITWALPKVEGDRRLSSFTTRYVQESQDFRLQPVIIRQDAALPCELDIYGDIKQQNHKSYQDDNTYGEGLGGKGIELLINITQSMIHLLYNPEGSPSGAEADATIQAHIVGTGQNYPTGHDSALSAGCATPSDLDDVTYATAEQKQKLCEAGGHTNAMYRPDAIDPTYTSKLDANDKEQWWIQTVTLGRDVKAENSNAYAARVEAAGDYMNCTLYTDDTQYMLPDPAACNKNWVSGAAGPPAAGGWNCNTSVPAQSVPGLNMAEAQHGVDTWFGSSCSNGTDNAWEQCMNDVTATAKQACVDPLFALAIWIHESGASNYQCSEAIRSGSLVQDFGINYYLYPPENFRAQLDRFVQLPHFYEGNCPDLTIQNFIARYRLGNYTPSGHFLCYNELSTAQQKVVDDYINELVYTYSLIAPGVSLPTWPGVSGCTPI